MFSLLNLPRIALSGFMLAGFASACPSVPHATCTACDTTVCSAVQCEPHWFNYDGDATNGCEAEYHVNTVCPLPAAQLGGAGYTGLCLNGWGSSCGADQANYIQTQAECEEFARATGVRFTLHNSVWKLGGCAYYMSTNPAQRSVFWFHAKPIGYVPAQTIRDKEVKAYAYICKDGTTGGLVPEATNCCQPTEEPTEQPTPQPTPQPIPGSLCTTYMFDFGSGCIGAQNFIATNTCPPEYPNPLSKAECEVFGATPRPSWRFYQTPRYDGEVSDPTRPYGCLKHSNQDLYVWNSDVTGVSTNNWWRLNCKMDDPIAPTEEPTPRPTDVPTPRPTFSMSCPTGYQQVTGQNMDGVGTTYTRTLADCAQKCEERFTHSGPRDCSSFQWSPTVRAGELGQCWLFVESAPTVTTSSRGPDFTFCQKEAQTPPCRTYETKLFSSGGTCLGVQNFVAADDCPIEYPTPLTKAQCEIFGATARPNWRFYQTPRYGGEVDDVSRPYGCVKHSNQNLYMWNTNVDGVSTDNWWQIVCKQDEVAVGCGSLDRKRRCQREGGCVWLRARDQTRSAAADGTCVSEAGVNCDIFSKSKCRDQRDRCTWGRPLGLGRNCYTTATFDCTLLSTDRRCGRAPAACRWTGTACAHL